MRYLKYSALVAALAVSAASLAAAQEASVRDRYYQTAGSPAPSGTVWAGVRTSILLCTKDGPRGECRFREVSEDHEFHQGDKFRLRVQANVPGYLYIVSEDPEGSLRLLFPDAKGTDVTSHMARMETRWIPDSDWFVFDADTGNEKLYLFVSPKPMKEMEHLLASPGRKLKDRELDRLLEKADKPSVRSEESGPDGDVGATYFVARADWSKDNIVRRFRLTHK